MEESDVSSSLSESQSTNSHQGHRHQRHLPLPASKVRINGGGVACPVTLKFEEIVYKVRINGGGRGGNGLFSSAGRITGTYKEKTILGGISGVVCPGELFAMLGPSGSGKTTLLSALGSRLQLQTRTGKGILSGKITYNGQPFSGPMRRRTGFVSQDDVLYPHLTVRETLVFTALLRLPSLSRDKGNGLSRVEKAAHADNVIAELGLDRVSNSMVGGPLFRGISGGEKKRLSIGLEMLINPSLLLLDEPTSGLDSTTAQRIVNTLKRLAAGGRTVITTIHQPSSRLYHMFDKVILLCEGAPIYHGRASDALDYFSSVGFSTSVTVNPSDLMLDLANGIPPDDSEYNEEQQRKKAQSEFVSVEQHQTSPQSLSVRDVLISAYDKKISPRLKAELCSIQVDKSTAVLSGNFGADTFSKKQRTERWSTSWWEQFHVLLSRGLKERRHEAFNKLKIFQVLSVATVAGLLWWHTPSSHIQDRTSLLFFFSVFWGFYPLYNAVFTFPQERSMLIKERSSGMYRLSSYFLARTAGDLPMELALPTAFVIIIYWMGGLKPDPLAFLLTLLVVLYNVLVSQSLGLAIGAILMDVKQATTLASVTTLIFLVAGGYYVQHIPSFIVWFKYLSYSYYCYKLLIGVHFRPNDVYDCSSSSLEAAVASLPQPSSVVMCRVTDFPAIMSVGLNHMWVDVCIMALMLVAYRIIAYMALNRVIPK